MIKVPGHPRDASVEAAAAELVPWVSDWASRHQLTVGEFIYLLHVLIGRNAQALCIAERNQMVKPQTGGL